MPRLARAALAERNEQVANRRSVTPRQPDRADTAVIGAGIIGISVAYYLAVHHGIKDVVLIDRGNPMAMTSAQSGENYRNWWPHPVMTAFTDHAIDLLKQIARTSSNRIHMTRRGYVLATRHARPDELIAELHRGYGQGAANRIRVHDGAGSSTYQPAARSDWMSAPDGVDILTNRSLIRGHFPSLAPDVETIVHIRRAGDIGGQQLGQHMLESIRPAGVQIRRASVTAIETGSRFTLHLREPDGEAVLHADRVVNAAGPFFPEIAAMLGHAPPVTRVYQQKIAFEDREGALPRTLPFTIDLDEQEIAWSDEDRDIMASDPTSAALLRPMRGGVHRRPEGGDNGNWIKLGWACNTIESDPAGDPPIDPNFPDLVLRAAGRLSPALRTYVGRLPRGARHYGGFYTMTPENWPLIGPTPTPGAFMAGALSGFGTMAATATGAVCAAWIVDAKRPPYADALSLARYDDAALVRELAEDRNKGVL